MDPFPLMYTRQPVQASTRFREFPLGPKSRPTKLNWININKKDSLYLVIVLTLRVDFTLGYFSTGISRRKVFLTVDKLILHSILTPYGTLDLYQEEA